MTAQQTCVVETRLLSNRHKRYQLRSFVFDVARFIFTIDYIMNFKLYINDINLVVDQIPWNWVKRVSCELSKKTIDPCESPLIKISIWPIFRYKNPNPWPHAFAWLRWPRLHGLNVVVFHALWFEFAWVFGQNTRNAVELVKYFDQSASHCFVDTEKNSISGSTAGSQSWFGMWLQIAKYTNYVLLWSKFYPINLRTTVV